NYVTWESLVFIGDQCKQHAFVVGATVVDVAFFFSSRRRHTRSVSAFLLNRSSDLKPLRDFIVEASSNLEHSSLIPFFLGLLYSSRISLRGRSAASLRQNCVTVFSFSKNHISSPSGRWSTVLLISSWGSTL